ncbi:MAG: hypothetical protein Q9166_002479 [cf. Caloplaca sp. 2 TL-2023]
MTDSQKNIRLCIWFSVLSLEQTISVITGRPSMVRDIDCTAILPSSGLPDPDAYSRPGTQNETMSLRVPIGYSQQDLKQCPSIEDPSFFVHYVELSSLADLALSNLYTAHIRHIKWNELQSTILELDERLLKWNADLSRPFPTESTEQHAEQNPARIAIGMLFHSTRILINRPCLCRLDYRIRHQSDTSDSINVSSADRCIASAQATLALIPDEPDLALIHQGPLWWMGFHHLKRAAVVLILGIRFLHQHPSAVRADVLTDSKKAVNWLHVLGLSSSPAYSAWVTLSRLLLRTARSVGGDVSGAIIAEEKPDPGSAVGGSMPAAQQPPYVSSSTSEVPFPMTLEEQGAGGGIFSNLGLHEWDQFESGHGEFFPLLMNDLDEMD